jgi:hypothetical protein
MLLGHRNDPIQAFPPESPDEPFAERIGLEAVHWCFDHFKARMLYQSVESTREDRVTVMKDKPIRVIGGDRLPQLLEGPGRGRMSRCVEMNNAA